MQPVEQQMGRVQQQMGKARCGADDPEGVAVVQREVVKQPYGGDPWGAVVVQPLLRN